MTETGQRPAAASFDELYADAWAPTVAADVSVRTYDDDLLAWAPTSSAPVHLPPLSAVLFQLLDGHVTVAELVDDVRAVLDTDEATTRDLLRQQLAGLDRGGLLESSVPIHSRGDRDLFPLPPNR